MEEELKKNCRLALQKVCDRFYNKAMKIPPEKYDWDDNAIMWYRYFVKAEDKFLKDIDHDGEEYAILQPQLQKIGEEEFEKLKDRIERDMAKSQSVK